MNLVNGAVEGLTRTESLIVSRYLSRSPPPKARELASELGVSIKTVYKALYKYRRLYGHLTAAGAQAGGDGSPAKVAGDADVLLEAIYELKASIDRLNETLSKLLAVLPTVNAVQQSPEGFAELPGFVRDNPWLQIIRSRSES